MTTVVRRRVRPDRRAEYEEWLDALLTAAVDIDGFLGADIQLPAPSAAEPEYVSVFRFGSVEQLHAFEHGDLNRLALNSVAPFVLADPVWSTQTGLEWWFDAPVGTVVAQPVRWRMAVVIGSVVYALVLLFGVVAAQLIGGWPYPLRLAVVIAVEITLMTYVLLPWLTRRLAKWIFPSTRTA